jgi:teichuronic acid exporter
MTLGDKIRRGIAWSFAGNTSGQAITFVVGIILARLLSPADFGILATIGVFTGIAGFVAGGGMGDALVRSKDITQRDYDVVFTLQLAIGLCIMAVIYALAPHIAAWYAKPEYSLYLRVSALSFLCRPFISIPNSILRRSMRFKAIAAARIAALLASSTASVILAFLGYGVWSLLAGGLVGSLTTIAGFSVASRWFPGLDRDFARARHLAAFGAMMAFGDFLVYLRTQASSFILSRTLGAHALGLFNKAQSLSIAPHGAITGAVYQVTFRALAAEADNIDMSRFLYLRSISLVCLYTWPIFATFFWLGTPLITVVYGEKWAASGPLLSWFGIVGPFIALEILAGSVLAARNWLKRELPIQFAQLVIVILGVAAGLPHGLTGVAVGASLANIYGALHMTWLASRSLQLPLGRILLTFAPAVALTAIQLMLWYVADATIWRELQSPEILYTAAMTLGGGLVYVSAFFLIPLHSTQSERTRWRSALGNLISNCRR